MDFVLGSQSPFQSSRENRATESDFLKQNQKAIYAVQGCLGNIRTEGVKSKDCGHPCERHNLHLRDSNGKDHKASVSDTFGLDPVGSKFGWLPEH